jgi:immune inhibitor A
MKKLVVTLIAVLLFSSAFAMLVSTVKSTPVQTNYIAIKDSPVQAKGDVITEDPIKLPSHHSYYAVGDVVTWIYVNTYNGNFYTRNFQLKGLTAHAEIWLSVSAPDVPLLSWPAGDPRVTPVVTDAELAYLLNEFENQIYPTDVANFGAPAVRDGSGAAYGPPGYYEGSTRTAILIMNIRDTNYYDSTYPYYVAGYFDPTITGYFTDRDIVTIDCYQWERRLGPTGTVWPPPAPPYAGGVDRPYVYDSTLAHEFQHLIHNDFNPSDDAFMNEGCSMYAEYLNGFGIDPSYINSFFYTPDNSLTDWGDQGDINILADYGQAALWTMYLSDHYGGAATITYFVQAGIPGIGGVNNALAHFNYLQRFDDVFQDWKLANLIRSDTPGGGKYNYHNIDLNDPSIDPIYLHPETGSPIPWTKGTSFGTTETILGYDTGVSMVGPYGSDYIEFTNWPTGGGILSFDGDDTAMFGWTTLSPEWWSGFGNMMNVQITGQAHVSAADPTLTLVTKYGIESNWDFGFVQVSTDNGHTWTSLSNAYTTSSYLTDVVAIQANMPGLTDYNPSWPNYDTMSFDLTAYAGMNIQVCFRYMTDEFTNYEGWFIQSAAVSGSSLTLTATYPKASFQVDLVWISSGIPYDTEAVSLSSTNNAGSMAAYAGDSVNIILVVSGVNHAGSDDYQFMVQSSPVGGEWISTSQITLLTPWISWSFATLVLTTAFVACIRYKKKQLK